MGLRLKLENFRALGVQRHLNEEHLALLGKKLGHVLLVLPPLARRSCREVERRLRAGRLARCRLCASRLLASERVTPGAVELHGALHETGLEGGEAASKSRTGGFGLAPLSQTLSLSEACSRGGRGQWVSLTALREAAVGIWPQHTGRARAEKERQKGCAPPSEHASSAPPPLVAQRPPRPWACGMGCAQLPPCRATTMRVWLVQRRTKWPFRFCVRGQEKSSAYGLFEF